MNRLPRVLGPALTLALSLAAATPREARAQLFHTGDGTGGAYASWVNNPDNTLNQVVFDRFHVPTGQTWTGSAVFADFSSSSVAPPVGALFWQVRSGMALGGTGQGTVVAAGSGPAGIVGDRYTVATAPIVLGAGDYWLGMYADLTGIAPNTPPTSAFFGPRATVGANAVNAVLDGAAFWLVGSDAALNGGNVNPIHEDISYGMFGQFVVTAAPEPGAWALLATGMVALVAVRRRRPG